MCCVTEHFSEVVANEESFSTREICERKANHTLTTIDYKLKSPFILDNIVRNIKNSIIMKKILLSALSAILFSFSSFAQLNCSKYYPMKEGTSFQYTNYDKKAKADGTSTYTVSKVETTGEKTIATMSIQIADKKSKELMQSTYEVICSDGGIKIDFESLMPTALLEQYKEMDVKMTGTDIELPNELSVGQNLADANVTMSISMSGMNMKTTVNMINRNVEKKESITTDAGTFECFVIYSKNETQVMGMTKIFPSRIWLSEGVGMVKQESYKENGDLMSTTKLTKINL